jgi:hypothetical protein
MGRKRVVRRVVHRRGKGRGISLPSRRASGEPATTMQALRAIADGRVPVRFSAELQREYERVSREHFKGKLPDCKIVLAELPKVKHRAFSVVTSNLRLIVINTARSKTLEEQKADLRHEIIHMAGVKGHGTLFQVYAEMLNAPVASTPEGKQLSYNEYSERLVKAEAQKEAEERRKREEQLGVKKGEGVKIIEGKPAARIIGWVGPSGKLVISKRNIWEDDWDLMVPKKAKEVWIVEFDALGHPKGDKTVPREELKNYYIVP